MKIIALTSCPTGVAHTFMAAEALKKTAALMGHAIRVETQGSIGTRDTLTEEEIAEADLFILAADIRVDLTRFHGKPTLAIPVSEAIRETKSVIQRAEAMIPGKAVPAADEAAAAPVGAAAATSVSAPKKIIAITACPTGIAHTFMAAEALQKAAKSLGYEIKVETQGSVGSQNKLTAEDIAAADAVVIAAETKVDTAPFAGKRLFMTSTKHAMHSGREVIETALNQPTGGGGAGLAESVEQLKASRSQARTGPYKHLMTGVSYMLPIVIAGGLSIALAFAFGGIHAGDQKGTLAAALSLIGGGAAFHLFVAALSGFIAYSIADRPGIAPGMVGGLLAQNLGAGFLGGIASGFLAGYLTKFLAEKIKLPPTLEGLKPVLILPFLSTIIVGLVMIYVIAPPVQTALDAMTAWLNTMRGTNAALLGIILGAMMAFDTGGPVNKAAYTFAVGLLASKVYTPMAAVMAAGMTPPLGMALAAWMFKSRFDKEERDAAAPAFVLGLSFITEGAIPFAAKDPLRVIPALVAGSAVAGAISMVCNVQFLVPHGGIFAAVIPGAVTHIVPYFVAIVIGTIVTAAVVAILKKPLKA